MPRYLICYDIVRDSRRRKVANCLDSYGDRVQDSVFELRISRRLLDECLGQLKSSIKHVEDKVAVYELCASCELKRLYFGAIGDAATIGEEAVFIV